MSGVCKKIYLNNAASAWPRAPGVLEAVAETLEKQPLHPGRTVTRSTDVVAECRERLAGILGVDTPNRVVLTTSSTHSLNLAIGGMGLRSGDRVVTSVTEHNSVLRPLNHLAERAGIQVQVIGLDSSGRIDEEAFEEALGREPRLVVFNHVSNVTGRVQNMRCLFEKAKRAGASTLLDASQSLGHIPVLPEEIQADMVAFTGHKGLRGPAGTGGLYVAPHLELEQFLVGGTGVRSDLALHPQEMPMRLEAGTPNIPGLAGLAAGLRWYENEGKAFQERENFMGNLLRDRLRETPGVSLYGDTKGADRVGITSFRIRGWEVEEVGYILSESFDITCRTGLHCAPLIHESIGSAPEGTIRFSVSGFNTEAEIGSAVNAVRKLAE